jgi:ammonium transporter, Amt family
LPHQVPVSFSPVFGVLGALFGQLAKVFGQIFLEDEPLFVWAIHAGAGFVGMVLTGPLAR